jgi:nitrogen fixation-related uncharacterized protein
MHPETYTRFYTLMAIALVLGFIGMEVATTGTNFANSISGMATHSVDQASSATGNGSPGSNLLFLLVGMVAGAVIVGTIVFIYHVERKRHEPSQRRWSCP